MCSAERQNRFKRASGKSNESFFPPRVVIWSKEPADKFLARKSLGNSLKVRSDFRQLFMPYEELAGVHVFKDPLTRVASITGGVAKKQIPISLSVISFTFTFTFTNPCNPWLNANEQLLPLARFS